MVLEYGKDYSTAPAAPASTKKNGSTNDNDLDGKERGQISDDFDKELRDLTL